MYDVAIIGAGVIGASVFRELSKYNIKTILIEKENDVSMGTSKANSAIVHAGYDPKIGTLMAKYNVKGNEMFEDLCKDLSVPFKRNGSLVLAFKDEDLETINDLYINGNKIGVKGLKVLSKEEVLEIEPNLSNDIKGALLAPTGGIVGPFEYTIALVENGIQNGGEIILNAEVDKINKKDETFIIETKNGKKIESRYVINAAGIYADKIHNMICKESFKITPRKGEYYVMDKSQGNLVSHTVFPCPSKLGKGILVTPTVHGNLLVGPNAVDGEDKESLNTTGDGLANIKKAAMHTTEKINFRDCIRTFAGLRAVPDTGDFIVGEDKEIKGFIDVAGIKSPGLSSAPAIAEDVVNILKGAGLPLDRNLNFNGKREQVYFMELSKEEKAELIKKDSRYGRIICRCESITEGEIIDAINRSFGKVSIDGVKRRCRPGMGRCQGGFCGPRVQEIISRELNINMEDIVQEKSDSVILYGKTK
ncbi:L-2-hydroxyglutarate oxidase LhgO [uncultured Clostridium sp.]|uniref:NAD(P)/FAD-dependent oxidoreductase n=1 Tax=uncultured Clostridium sp. TaxID=59620 RepID=UPI000820470A|nr:NAD(P)/FAD-dependent oxidoreductase [uncultured Clostridium sp.]SCI98476.1 L-2-hydroxyglutarate oxidase LhgO [uncultured Clostridium sp.]